MLVSMNGSVSRDWKEKWQSVLNGKKITNEISFRNYAFCTHLNADKDLGDSECQTPVVMNRVEPDVAVS